MTIDNELTDITVISPYRTDLWLVFNKDGKSVCLDIELGHDYRWCDDDYHITALTIIDKSLQCCYDSDDNDVTPPSYDDELMALINQALDNDEFCTAFSQICAEHTTQMYSY